MSINSGGGKTYCPWREARIIMTSTPLFAKQVSSKLAYGSARDVQRDLRKTIAVQWVSYIQRVSEAVASIIEAKKRVGTMSQTGG